MAPSLYIQSGWKSRFEFVSEEGRIEKESGDESPHSKGEISLDKFAAIKKNLRSHD